MDRLAAMLCASPWVDRPIASLELSPRGWGIAGVFDLRVEYASGHRWLDGRNPSRVLVKTGSGPTATEARVYTELLPRPGLATPLCYAAQSDVLLLEAPRDDVSRQTSLDRARVAVDRIAGFHGAFWNDAALAELGWLGPTELPHFTLVHGNLRGGALFETARAGAVLADFGSVRLGDGAADLADFTTLSLDAAVRERHEWELVTRYHAAVRRTGVNGYDLGQCWDAYQSARRRQQQAA